VRGLLIVNPQATSTTGSGADLVARTLEGLVDLDVTYTRYRGHARELAAAATADVIIVFGGDGVINEVVNGLMERTAPPADPADLGRAADPAPARAAHPADLARAADLAGQAEPAARPVLAAIPGGGGNVFARALGLPTDPAAAIESIRDLLAAGTYRTIGLTLAGDRYFTFSAGLGMDAEVVHDVEGLRARGRRESQTLFVRAIVRRYYSGTDRRRPALTLERDGQPPVNGLFMGVVTNSAPWTYFRGRPLLPRPDADFSSGLNIMALSRLKMSTIISAIGQMLLGRTPRGRHIMTAQGLDVLTIRGSRPIALHVDGEYLGEIESVKFQFVPRALRVVAPPAP